MKKKLLLLAIITMEVQQVSGQMLPFVSEGKTWYCEYRYPTDPHTSSEGHYSDDGNSYIVPRKYTLSGDTIVGNVVYAKLFSDGKYEYALRQDGDKVFVLPGESAEETLLYDFALKQDEIFHCADMSTRLLVTSVDTILVDGILRRRIAFAFDYELSGDLTYSGKEIIASADECWVEGIGSIYGPIAPYQSYAMLPLASMELCEYNGKVLFRNTDFYRSSYDYNEDGKCATPTIAYDNGKLLFSCETEGAECVYEIKCTDEGGGRGSEVTLSQTYEIRVHATLDGHYDSDEAVATIGWRNGRPVMEGFSSVTLGDGEGSGDVNGDGVVDVADIAAVIAVMAGQEGRRQAE